jgi:hypothetical protein
VLLVLAIPEIFKQNSITSGDFNSLARQLKGKGLMMLMSKLEQLVKQTAKPTKR